MVYYYPALFSEEENGIYSVYFPDFKQLATCGTSFANAMQMAVDLLAGHIISALEEGIALPSPSKIEAIDAEKIIRELMEDQYKPSNYVLVNYITVDPESYAKEYFTKTITLTIDKWLYDKAMKRQINLAKELEQLLQERSRSEQWDEEEE